MRDRTLNKWAMEYTEEWTTFTRIREMLDLATSNKKQTLAPSYQQPTDVPEREYIGRIQLFPKT